MVSEFLDAEQLSELALCSKDGGRTLAHSKPTHPPVRKKITIVAPTPPPYAGPEVSTAHLLTSPLAEEFNLVHIRSNLKAKNSQKGAFSLVALVRQLVLYYRIAQTRLHGSRALYVLVAVNVLGFLKDAGSIWLGRFLGMRVVAHMKGATLPTFYAKSPRVLRWLILVTMRRIDVMIVQAAPIREEIAATFDLSKSRLPIIPNMVDGVHRCEGRRPGRRLLFMGHLSVGKGFVDLLSVMEAVFTEYPDAVLRCAGESKAPARDYVAQLIGVEVAPQAVRMIRLALQGHLPQVEYMGLVHDEAKDKLLCESDILVLPSYSESFPLVVLEAMSYGCAVIATTVGALPEIIANGSEGILVSPGDRRALATAIRMLLSDDELRTRLASAGQAKVEAAYTVERVVPLYAEVFRGVLTKTPHL